MCGCLTLVRVVGLGGCTENILNSVATCSVPEAASLVTLTGPVLSMACDFPRKADSLRQWRLFSAGAFRTPHINLPFSTPLCCALLSPQLVYLFGPKFPSGLPLWWVRVCHLADPLCNRAFSTSPTWRAPSSLDTFTEEEQLLRDSGTQLTTTFQ